MKRAGIKRATLDQVVEMIRANGWSVALPSGKGSDQVHGFICGDQHYFEKQVSGEHDMFEPAVTQ